MFRPGSIPWFLSHELRVTWRTWFQRGQRKRTRSIPVPLVVAAILVIVTLAAGVPVANWLRDTEFVVTPIVAFLVDATLLLMFTLMLSQTLVAAVDAFYARGDLDLLLSSPISPRRILAVRALAMALNPALMFWAITTPFVIPLAVLGHPEVLAVPIVIACLALVATAIGLAIAIGLFSLIGPRRTRTVAQVLGALVGAAFVIVAQIPGVVARDEGEAPATGFIAGLLDRESLPALAMWPAQATLGSLLPLLLFVALAVGLFAGSAAWVGRRFARDAAAASGADTTRRKTGRGRARFGASVIRATVSKEVRLLLRDPGLISQVLLRVFYLVPLAVVLLTDTGESAQFMPAVIAAGATLLAGQLAGSVAWINIGAEDAPQLLASAPVPMRAFWRAKLVVSLLVPGVLLLPLLVAFAFINPLGALAGAAGATASAWSAAMINLWLQKPSKRSEFRRAMSSNFGATALELLSTLSIAAAVGMFVAGFVYAWVAVGVAVVIIALARRSEGSILDRMSEA